VRPPVSPGRLAEEERRIAAGWAEFWHYTSLGRYGEQLEHLFGLFQREQVLLFHYRALIDDPARALDGLRVSWRAAGGAHRDVAGKRDRTPGPDPAAPRSPRPCGQAARSARRCPSIPGRASSTISSGSFSRTPRRESR
jgi:hypothetical protein